MSSWPLPPSFLATPLLATPLLLPPLQSLLLRLERPASGTTEEGSAVRQLARAAFETTEESQR